MSQLFSSSFSFRSQWMLIVVFFIAFSHMGVEAKKGGGKPQANPAPELVVHAPTDGSTLVAGEPITFSASATDPQEGNLNHWINWHSNVNGWLGIGGEISRTLSEGTHRLTVHVTDSDGNRAQQILTLNVTAYVNQAPTLSLLEPTYAATYYEGDSLVFAATAGDVEDGDLSDSVNWSSNLDGFIGQGNGFSGALSVGEHIITAMVQDSHGASVEQTTQVTVLALELAAPQLTVLSPIAGNSYDSAQAVIFQATADDAQQGNLNHWINWHSNLNGWLGIGGEISKVLKVGTHRITAHVTDSDGNRSQSIFEITVAAGAPVNQLPSLSVASPLAGSSHDSGSVVTLQASANDAEDGDLSASIEWVSNRDGLLTVGGYYQTTLSDGEHTITVTVTDSDGASRSESFSITMVAVQNNGGQATVHWVAPTENTDNSALTNLSGYRVYFGDSMNNVKAQSVWVDASNTQVTIDGLSQGVTYYFSVVAVNDEGLESDLSNVASKTIQ